MFHNPSVHVCLVSVHQKVESLSEKLDNLQATERSGERGDQSLKLNDLPQQQSPPDTQPDPFGKQRRLSAKKRCKAIDFILNVEMELSLCSSQSDIQKAKNHIQSWNKQSKHCLFVCFVCFSDC